MISLWKKKKVKKEKKGKKKERKKKFIGGFGNLLITDNLHIIACILLSILCLLIGYRELDDAVDYSGSSI